MFVVHDDADISVHSSIDDALAYVEPWDVNPSLRVFDSRGTCFRFREEGVIRTKRTVAGGQTLLDEPFPGDERPGELVEILREWISQVGPQRFGLSEDAAGRGEFADLVNAVAVFSGIK